MLVLGVGMVFVVLGLEETSVLIASTRWEELVEEQVVTLI